MDGLKISFGHIIAFLLPGTVTTRALAYFFPTIQTALDSLVSGASGALGQSTFLIGVAATLGLTTSILRGQYLDPVFGWFRRGCKPAKGGLDWKTDYERVKAAGEIWEKVVENFYRFYQFTANLSLALFVLVAARLVVYNFQWNRDAPVTVTIFSFALLLLRTAYLQFKEWCNVRDSILGSVTGGSAEITKAGTPEAPATTATAPTPTAAAAPATSRSDTTPGA